MRLQPYTLQPAKGKSFYNRDTLFERIMRRSQEARHTHLLGMRGAGKTSILLKIMESKPSLYFTFQAMGGKLDKFQGQTRLQLRRQRKKYAWLPQMQRQDDPFDMIGEAAILAEEEGQVLFLLFDEVEGLQRFEADFLQQVGYLLSEALPVCVVLASAKNISNLNEKVVDTGNSPLFFPSPDYLTPFENEAANALISQSKSDKPLKVPLSTMKAIKHHTNNQPLLIQWLCHHLWSRNQNPIKWQITDDLLHVSKNDQLTHRFQADFKYLSPQERRILRAVLHKRPLPTDITSNRHTRFLSGLSRLGYLRQVNGCYEIGNTFLLRWFEDNEKTLDWQDRTQQPSDKATEALYGERETQKSKAGRPRDPDNVWANEQVNLLGRKPREVKLEWVKRRKVRGTYDSLADPNDTFRKAIRPKRN